jgi:hypothetical protein
MLGRAFWQVKPANPMVYTKQQGDKFLVWQDDSWRLIFYGLRAIFQSFGRQSKAIRSLFRIT